MTKGDIILVPFPFTDLTGQKNRSALVLLATDLDVTVAFITTQLNEISDLDLLILPDVENGLKKKSVIRVSKIATLDKNIVLGKLGIASETTLKEVDLKLINAFSLSF
ncbi:type II toxin-antitoxin system PemK/MazF family toxin [Algoriphagus sp. AGSA1]|uniref:type II toxin-antitoxin system PemK/MazF family toxin n=1 Tax=Algoriphagus sp. AGSA1 TaxID=2907213 RepID=UPI001F2E248E|nr:type II toxin-antitoxin system PemK/MazF family toxin [Algoriphagus sp. AGSA1]